MRSPAAPALAGSAFHAVAQSQYLFVLPWMIVARGGSASSAVLSASTAFVPYLFVAPLAGLLGDRVGPRRLLGATFAASAAAAALYPVSALAGRPTFVLVYASALAFGIGRPFVDAGLFRAIAAESPRDVMRLQSARSVLGQAGGFGGPALGLVLFHWRGVEAVCVGVTALLGLAAAAVVVAPERRSPPTAEPVRAAVRSSLAFLRGARDLRRIAIGICIWNLVAGAAFSVVSPLLEHAGMSAQRASLVFLGGAVGIALLTVPVVQAALRVVPATAIFAAAIVAEGVAFAVFSRSLGALLVVSYVCFVVANSVASSASSGARAVAIRPHEQAFLNVLSTAGAALAYLVGVLVAGGAARALQLGPAALAFAVGLVALGIVLDAAHRRTPAAGLT
jgi:MFS family permease